jgi:hypothetical protein
LEGAADTASTGVLQLDNERNAMISKCQPKFSLGQLLSTLGAVAALQKANQSALKFLQRHARGDWGDLCDEDREANDQSLVDGSRILSAYHTLLGEKIWVITEATDDSGKRAATTILLPSEY